MLEPQTPRLAEELRVIQSQFPQAQYLKDSSHQEWIMIPDYPLPYEIWQRDRANIATLVKPTHPHDFPYGLYVEGPMQVNGTVAPDNYSPGVLVPFEGSWGVFSWYIENWQPKAKTEDGDNLLKFFLGAKKRFLEGK
jgi:hypothetical protein